VTIPRRRKTATVTVGWTHPVSDEEYEVECSVSPYVPERGPSYSSAGEPAEGPEVEILRVFDAAGKERPDLLARVEMAWDEIEESAIEEAEESHAAAWEAADEDRADAAREERWAR
jgi:hypothetical protein